jgi:uracil-DNA glycosylase family 4
VFEVSFFFNKQKAKSEFKASSVPKKANKSSKDTLNRLGCRACPLDKADNHTPKMSPDLADQTDVYILGSQPSQEDDEKAEPFSSKAGRLVRSLCGRIDHVSFDYVIRDFSNSPAQPAWVALECCRSMVVKSIEQAKPKMVIGLGIEPMQWMLNSADMVGLRGRIFAVKIGNHSCYFMPTYDPQYVIDNAFKKGDPLRSKLGHCLKFDIAKAKAAALDWDPPSIDAPQAIRAGLQAFDGKKAGQLAQLLKLMSEAARAPERAIDIEGTGLKAWATGAKILTCALSYGKTNFAFALGHRDAGWKPDELKQILKALKEVLAGEGKIIAHHASFEISWFIHLLGRDSIYHDNWECTMMQSHFLDERRGKKGGNDDQFQPNPYQALDFLVRQYFGLAYKATFKVDRKNMAAADLAETLVYNCADTKYTLRLYYTQKALLKQSGLLSAYREAIGRQPTVALMQDLGIDVDQKEVKRLQKKLGGEIAKIEARINSYPEVKAFIKDRKTFNPASDPEVLDLLKKYIKVGDVLKNADGKESTDKTVLARISHPVAKDLEESRNRNKLKSTYVDPFELGKGAFIFPDGKMHPSCNTTFAETGRTSSSAPNQQNWPSRNDKWVRKQIRAPDGHVLVAFDYGQLEACTGAMCSKDKVLIKSLWEDYDIHKEWAIKAAHKYPAFIKGLENLKNEEVMDKFRSRIKNKLVFPVFFGATNTSVAGYLNAPIEPINKLMDEFWKTFHGVYSWQKGTMDAYYDVGFVTSLTGRRRNHPLTKNQAINYPIQSVACDIVCRAMVRLSQIAADTGNWYLHPIMNIHDDLTFIIPDDPKILEESIETIYRIMLSPGYDFINVPLSVSCSVGENWLDMDKIGKFWSHKDL